MKNVRIRASVDEIAKSLQGNWRTEHLFALKQALAAFDFIGRQVADCGREIEMQLEALQIHDGIPAKGKKRSRARMDKPKAVTAAAHKLARLICTMLSKGEEYTNQGQDYCEERYRQRVLRQLAQRAEKIGMKLVASEQPA